MLKARWVVNRSNGVSIGFERFPGELNHPLTLMGSLADMATYLTEYPYTNTDTLTDDYIRESITTLYTGPTDSTGRAMRVYGR